MEKRKMQIGCLIGLPTGLLIALVFKPMFWWLGILAGLCAGYVIYDLREIREKAPIAWQLAKRGSTFSFVWLKKPHPIFWQWLVVFGISTYFIVESILWGNFLGLAESEKTLGCKIFELIFFPFCAGYIWAIILLFPILELASIGAKRKKIFWQPSRFFTESEVKEMLEKDYQVIPLTCRNIYSLALTGLGYWLLTALQTIPKVIKGVGIGLKMILWFLFYEIWVLLGRFIWILAKLIHSRGRVVCGIDCAVGVYVCYTFWGVKTDTGIEVVLLLLCGALIGWTFGTIHYKLAQLIRLAPIVNNH